MRREFILDTFEIIDDRFIEEAKTFQKAKKNAAWVRYIGIAASVLIVAGIAVMVIKLLPRKDTFTTENTLISESISSTATEETLQTSHGSTNETVPDGCGEEGVIITDRACVHLTGVDYWLTNEEAYAFLMENYAGIKNSLEASGVNAQNMVISETGYGHYRTNDNSVAVNWRDFLVYNDEDLISVISVSKDENGLWYGIAFGGSWYSQYNSFLQQHAGQQLVYLYYGDMEAIVTPDNKIYRFMDFAEFEGLVDGFDYYSFFNQETNTYIPN
ncbi:MAG: hypothetical protein IKG93_01635 [Clostridiales bacterium]|nr:hypothetical protein [Clostridiales bacterium]MBR3056643.1 hypothetical protein [Clostridiales bacterium]